MITHKHLLYPILKALLLLIFSIPTRSFQIIFPKYSQELLDFCGFDVVLDVSKFIIRFKQDFLLDHHAEFDRLVNLTEPICRRINADEAFMPPHTAVNPAVQQMYINHYFCYSYNLGMVKNLSPYNQEFLKAHRHIAVEKKSDFPDEDKISDSKALI